MLRAVCWTWMQHIPCKPMLCLDDLAGMSISACNYHASSCGVHASLHPVVPVMHETVAVRPPSCSQAAIGGRAARGMLASPGILHPQCEAVTCIPGCVKPVHIEWQLAEKMPLVLLSQTVTGVHCAGRSPVDVELHIAQELAK